MRRSQRLLIPLLSPHTLPAKPQVALAHAGMLCASGIGARVHAVAMKRRRPAHAHCDPPLQA